MGDLTFQVPPLGHALAAGLVTETTARLWGRTDAAGPLTVVVRCEAAEDATAPVARVPVTPDPAADQTFSLRVPPESGAAAVALTPGTSYAAQLLDAAGAPLASCRFETAPAAGAPPPARFSLGALSCHQPFDEEGRVQPDAVNMLRAVARAYEEHDTKRLVFMGDQVYADTPARLSLFDPAFLARKAPGARSLLDCPADVIRRLYHERYRAFWGLPEFMALQQRWASAFMLDDHEIVDDWGSPPEHALPEWQRLRWAALEAFFDYQASRAHPAGLPPAGGFHQGFRYGDVAVFVTDVRSQRHPGTRENRIFGEAQLDAFARFADETRACRVLVIVVSVPLVHLPRSLTEVGQELFGRGNELADRWSAPQSVPERDRFLRLLRQHQCAAPHQRAVLLSGDIHLGCAAIIRFADGGPPLYELVTSAVTNRLDRLPPGLGKLSGWMMHAADEEGLTVELMRGEGANPFTGLNAGILEIVRDGNDNGEGNAVPLLRWKLVTTDGKSDRPRIAFDTGLF